MTTQTEQQTVEQLAVSAQAGDAGAFRCLVERTHPMAFRLAFRLLTDDHDARDAAQESFIRLWDHLDRYDPTQRFETWFYRIVTNVAMDRLRARKRRWGVFPRTDRRAIDAADPSTLESAGANAELAGIIRTLTDDLPERQRAVIVLRDLQDCSTEEVAEILGISVASVKTNLHYARARIRSLMQSRFGIRKEDV